MELLVAGFIIGAHIGFGIGMLIVLHERGKFVERWNAHRCDSEELTQGYIMR